jgi:hypothetical protein
MQVLGMKVISDKVELTQNFIRGIMLRLQRQVNIASQKALMIKI